MSELPQGWALTTLGEITDFNPKLQLDDSLEVGFVPMSHAPTNFRDKLRFDPRPWAEVRKAYTHFADGDVIFAKVTPCFENGKAAVVSALPNGTGAGSSEFHVLRPASMDISSTYLLALVKSSSFMREGEAAMTGAVGLRRVPRGFVENFPAMLPPAAEQTRIAQALDGLLAQVDTLTPELKPRGKRKWRSGWSHRWPSRLCCRQGSSEQASTQHEGQAEQHGFFSPCNAALYQSSDSLAACSTVCRSNS